MTPLLRRGGLVAWRFRHCLAKADPYSVDYATDWPRRTRALTSTQLVKQGGPVPFAPPLGRGGSLPWCFFFHYWATADTSLHRVPGCRLFLTSASADQYPDAILTAGSGWTHSPSVDSCSGAFLTPPSADPYPHVFPTAWPRRTGTLGFFSRLDQGGLVELRFHHCLAKADP
ncbi:hypothetical protein Y032_1033g3449 [Ancylostoma ceylanicum]|uniref:Uncharacterized protein n=1 Tax=Ancylostoma ceylanicum TaxID=53326 RepID=A0A016W6V5_9BILA|nr:hypothetical protein Y032_1033g3449 [Ancylostoma ceylanicum]